MQAIKAAGATFRLFPRQIVVQHEHVYKPLAFVNDLGIYVDYTPSDDIPDRLFLLAACLADVAGCEVAIFHGAIKIPSWGDSDHPSVPAAVVYQGGGVLRPRYLSYSRLERLHLSKGANPASVVDPVLRRAFAEVLCGKTVGNAWRP